MKYENICKAILKKAKEEKTDYRDLMREWINLFEKTRVVGWNRDEFFDCMIKIRKERKGNGNKIHKQKM